MASARKSATKAKKPATTRRSGDSDTREKVIDAAVRTILQLGFYRASSNAIAREAGVTWGVIQHYFGTREQLMLEVLERGAEEFRVLVAGAEIDGSTPAERLEQLVGVLQRHYGRPEFLAYTQVLLNLDHDPEAGPGIRNTMRAVAANAADDHRRLLRQAAPGSSADQDALHLVVKGFLLAQQLRAGTAYDTDVDNTADEAAERRRLVRLLTPYFESVED